MGPKYPSFTVFFGLIMTSILCFLIFLAALAFYISAKYNYNTNGTIIEDDVYKTAQTWRVVYIVCLIVGCTSLGVTMIF